MKNRIEDGRLVPIYEKTLNKVSLKVQGALEEKHLVNPDGTPIPPLTDSGLTLITKALAKGIQLQFANMDIKIPSEYLFEEVGGADLFTKGTDTPNVELTERKTLKLTFSGSAPILKSIEAPLDQNGAPILGKSSDNRDVYVKIEFGQRYILVPGQQISLPDIRGTQLRKQ